MNPNSMIWLQQTVIYHICMQSVDNDGMASRAITATASSSSSSTKLCCYSTYYSILSISNKLHTYNNTWSSFWWFDLTTTKKKKKNAGQGFFLHYSTCPFCSWQGVDDVDVDQKPDLLQQWQEESFDLPFLLLLSPSHSTSVELPSIIFANHLQELFFAALSSGRQSPTASSPFMHAACCTPLAAQLGLLHRHLAGRHCTVFNQVLDKQATRVIPSTKSLLFIGVNIAYKFSMCLKMNARP